MHLRNQVHFVFYDQRGVTVISEDITVSAVRREFPKYYYPSMITLALYCHVAVRMGTSQFATVVVSVTMFPVLFFHPVKMYPSFVGVGRAP